VTAGAPKPRNALEDLASRHVDAVLRCFRGFDGSYGFAYTTLLDRRKHDALEARH
jgi:hypothetical protein